MDKYFQFTLPDNFGTGTLGVMLDLYYIVGFTFLSESTRGSLYHSGIFKLHARSISISLPNVCFVIYYTHILNASVTTRLLHKFSGITKGFLETLNL